MTETTEFSVGSLKRRYVYKLSANLCGLVVSVFTQALIPRGLGPIAYGEFNFISNFFNQVIGFFDMGSSTAFYTKLCQRPQESQLLRFYLYFSSGLFLGILLLVCIVFKTSLDARFWPGQSPRFISMGAIFCLLVWLVQLLNNAVDAYGLTTLTEVLKIFQKIVGFMLICLLFFSHQLNLKNYFLAQYLILGLLAGLFLWSMATSGYSLLGGGWRLSVRQLNGYIKEFYAYCHPLFLYSIIGPLAAIIDRWILEIYGGNKQQGFYGLSFQIGAVCFLFTNAMTPLLTREFSIAFGKKDLAHMGFLFRRYIPLLYSVAAYFSCFIALQSDRVIALMGGRGYQEAGWAVAIMAFYPLHQTYGQLSAAVFYAAEQTKLYRNIGIVFMLLGLPATYFCIAPRALGGLGAGAWGLSLKMVLIQIAGVNVQLFYNARFLKLNFLRYLAHQFVNVGAMLSFSFFARLLIDAMKITYGHGLWNFFLSGVLYTAFVATALSFKPALFGLKHDDIRSLWLLIAARLKITLPIFP